MYAGSVNAFLFSTNRGVSVIPLKQLAVLGTVFVSLFVKILLVWAVAAVRSVKQSLNIVKFCEND